MAKEKKIVVTILWGLYWGRTHTLHYKELTEVLFQGDGPVTQRNLWAAVLILLQLTREQKYSKQA